jgi:hypothetical protein
LQCGDEGLRSTKSVGFFPLLRLSIQLLEALLGLPPIPSGNSGSVTIQTPSLITANAQSGEGGNIALRGDALVLRQNSLINATAGGTGNGGNITLTPQ